eukprot:3425997-Lingulodinium_polyedra.AAC.1
MLTNELSRHNLAVNVWPRKGRTEAVSRVSAASWGAMLDTISELLANLFESSKPRVQPLEGLSLRCEGEGLA